MATTYTSVLSRKDNGENIIKSIKKDLFQMGKLGLRCYCWSNLRVQFIQGQYSKRTSTPHNHNTDAKDIWENVKMILEGSELKRMTGNLSYTMNLNTSVKSKEKTFKDTTLGFELINDMRKHQEGQCPGMQLNSNCMPYIYQNEGNKCYQNIDDDVDDSPRMICTQLDHILKWMNVMQFGLLMLIEGSHFTGPCSWQTSHLKIQLMKSGHHYDSNKSIRDVEDNRKNCVQCTTSSVRNDALMSILDEMHGHGVQSRLTNKPDMSALYNGYVLVTTNHTPTVIHDSEDTRELAEITRKRMLLKMQSPLCVENKVRIFPPDYSKENFLATFAPQRNLTPEQIFWSIDDNNRKKAETLAPKPISALTVYPPNTPVKLVPRILPTKSQVKINLYVLTQLFTEFDKTCKTRITPSGLTEGERGFEQTKRCYLTEVIPFFKTLKEHFVGVQTALFKEVKEMEEIFDQMNNEVDKNTVDKQCAEIEKKNLLIENENLIVNCLSTQLLYDVAKSRCLDLEADVSKVHDESKLISKLEREYLNLQLKYQHLQESFDNKNSQASQEAPDFNSFFKIKNLEHQIQEKDNVIRHLKDLVTNVNDRSREPYSAVDVTALIEQNNCDRLELEKVKQHYKELFDSIKILRAHTSEKTSTMLNEIESLKAQLRSKEPCFTSDYVKPKVLAPGMYAIDVKPIPHPLKNNRSAHLNYIGHLKESVETVREIVEEARVVKPLDSSLNYACRYTKLSQELLECVIGTCPKNFNERDNKAPSTPVTRKKQVTFSDKPGTSSSNTQKHKVHQRVQLTNIPVLPSTGVNDSTEASGSKPRSNTKKNRILPAKKENKKEVEVRLRTNRSVWTKVNRVDSSISSKRVVINSNSESVNSASNGMCVVNVLNSVNATPTVRIVLHKEKQIWKPKGKMSDNSLNKSKQIWKPKGKVSDNRKKLTLGKLDCGSQWRPTRKKFALGEMCNLTKLSCRQVILWYMDSSGSKHMTGYRSKPKYFVEKFMGQSDSEMIILGAYHGLMDDYVIGDSEIIKKSTTWMGLGHNLFL
ncbi:hypothetical protein Tco_0026028 [Tanacetum coccineum]